MAKKVNTNWNDRHFYIHIAETPTQGHRQDLTCIGCGRESFNGEDFCKKCMPHMNEDILSLDEVLELTNKRLAM
jgi:hypothetical protein